MLLDTHCHLTDDQFEDDRWEALARARATGVRGVVSVASNARDVGRILELLVEARDRVEIPRLWGTAGIHPHDAGGAGPDDLKAVADWATGHEEIVAIGETGLDFFYDHSPRDVQEALFRAHLELARSSGLPVVVHSRNADELTGGILREYSGRVRGVLHCFTGSKNLLETALEGGWMVSFTGIITFKKFKDEELLRLVPRDRLMVETDGPYLAPVPHRGKRNEPAFVARVAEAMASIRGEELLEVQRYTTENAQSFFGLDLGPAG